MDSTAYTFLVILIIVISVLVACLFIRPVTECINKCWPQCLTLAAKGVRIHPEISYKPYMQEDEKSKSKCWVLLSSLFKPAKETPPPPTPSKQHNHRAITHFQTVLLASKTSRIFFEVAKLDKYCKLDRAALESFFQDTHHEEFHWSNRDTGSGRLHWLDKHRDIQEWQGVTVYKDGGLKGRIQKLQLAKNNITGPLDALRKVTTVEKISMWRNNISGSLAPLQDMQQLQQLDLSRNCLSGTLAPLEHLVCLQELNLGYNRLEGDLAPLKKLGQLKRMVVCDNSLSGTLEEIGEMETLQTIDLSNNPKLHGSIPVFFDEKWINGELSLNTMGTQIGIAVNRSKQSLPTSGNHIMQSRPSSVITESLAQPASPSLPHELSNQILLAQSLLTIKHHANHLSQPTKLPPLTSNKTPLVPPTKLVRKSSSFREFMPGDSYQKLVNKSASFKQALNDSSFGSEASSKSEPPIRPGRKSSSFRELMPGDSYQKLVNKSASFKQALNDSSLGSEANSESEPPIRPVRKSSSFRELVSNTSFKQQRSHTALDVREED